MYVIRGMGSPMCQASSLTIQSSAPAFQAGRTRAKRAPLIFIVRRSEMPTLKIRKEEISMNENNEASLDGSILWQYRLHEDTIFYQRLNFFLVAESMLLVAFATFVSGPENSWVVRLIITALGLCVTFAWLYVSHRQMIVIRQIQQVAENHVPTYKYIRVNRPKTWPGSFRMLAYMVPLIVIVAWLFLAIALWH
jgi:hypothetical protein